MSGPASLHQFPLQEFLRVAVEQVHQGGQLVADPIEVIQRLPEFSGLQWQGALDAIGRRRVIWRGASRARFGSHRPCSWPRLIHNDSSFFEHLSIDILSAQVNVDASHGRIRRPSAHDFEFGVAELLGQFRQAGMAKQVRVDALVDASQLRRSSEKVGDSVTHEWLVLILMAPRKEEWLFAVLFQGMVIQPFREGGNAVNQAHLAHAGLARQRQSGPVLVELDIFYFKRNQFGHARRAFVQDHDDGPVPWMTGRRHEPSDFVARQHVCWEFVGLQRIRQTDPRDDRRVRTSVWA